MHGWMDMTNIFHGVYNRMAEHVQAFPGTGLSIHTVTLGVTVEAAMRNVILTPQWQRWARMETLSQCLHPWEFVTCMNRAKPFIYPLTYLSTAVAGLLFSQVDQMQRYLSKGRTKCWPDWNRGDRWQEKLYISQFPVSSCSSDPIRSLHLLMYCGTPVQCLLLM